MTNAKIRLKVGSMELEYEGDPSFLDGGIEALLASMGDLAVRVPDTSLQSHVGKTEETQPNRTEQVASDSFNFSTNTIAAHLDAKSGSDLVICAMTNLELVQGKTSSSRAEILAEMKSATTYYKNTMSNNLSKSLSTLLKDKRINQVAKDSYALSATERKQVEAKVAEIG
ncbi:hypothetical protein [Roseinatronobacter sp.]|uniref:hypothetical protein n=1 Tax=Roseinatronobacter sp. TaxID=1945755 RepID=UPI003F6F5CC1